MSAAATSGLYPAVSKQDLNHVLEHTGPLWKELAGVRMFITGGTGFVGKWLLETLVFANDQMNVDVAAHVLTRDPERFRSESPHLADHRAIELLQGDACTFDFPDGEFGCVVHAATESSRDPAAFERDVAATRRVLEFASDHGTPRLLFTSSGAAYGKQPPELAHIPEDYLGAPLTTDTTTAYGQAKRASEFLCAAYARQYGFATLIARLFAFMGPYLPLDRNFAAGNFIRDVLAGGPIRIAGDGTPYRSYLYAADLSIWLWTILVRGESARIYNVGSDQPVTIAQLARTVADVAGRDVPIEIAQRPSPGAAPQRYIPCVSRARAELVLEPWIPLEEGVRRTLEWAGRTQ